MNEETELKSNEQNPANLLDTMINLVNKDEIHSIIDSQRQMLVFNLINLNFINYIIH